MRRASSLSNALHPKSIGSMATRAFTAPMTREAMAPVASMLPAGTSCTKVDYGSEGGLFKQSWSTTPVLVCGPGSIGVAHKADEYVEISQIEACDRFLSALTDSLCV